MGLTGAMITGFTGIKTNQFAIETIGDNVANVNTTAFKSQRALFETQYYNTIHGGTAPDAATGGTNPIQIGHGSDLATIQRIFLQGTLDPTGVPSDLGVQGNGFFVLDDPSGERQYTRDGSFRLDAENRLVSNNGAFVKGFAADGGGAIIPGVLENLTIPVGATSTAEATTEVMMDGNLDAAAAVADTASVSTTVALNTAGGPASDSTALTSLVDEDGAAMFADGDEIVVSGVEKGGNILPPATFTVGTDGSTLSDFAAFLEDALLINTDASTGGSPGVAISDGAAGPQGALVITSNLGEASALNLENSYLRNATTGLLPFEFSTTPAVGEGVTTGFVINDSLGNPVEVRLRTALESRDATGSVWRYYVESPDDPAGVIGTGTVTLDVNGQFLSATGTDVTIDRSGTGAVTPLSFSLDFSTLTGLVGLNGESTLVMASQNGRPAGTLVAYQVGNDGVITGTFSNGGTQVFGQVALATFTNPEGLIGRENNTFVAGADSGEAVVLAPQSEGAGTIQSGSLESANVDLSREFIGLITASTGFSAAGRVVRTADDLLQELLLLVR